MSPRWAGAGERNWKTYWALEPNTSTFLDRAQAWAGTPVWKVARPPSAHLQVGFLQPVVDQLRVALLLLQLLLQLGNAGLQTPLLLQRQGSAKVQET